MYKPIESSVLVKHVFQSFDKPEVYGEKLDDPKDYFRETTQTGLTGTSLKIQPLPDNEIEGYVPESNDIKTQVPENPKGFVVEFRYNRASYDLIYDTDGGTPIPSRRVYYKQVIPKLSGNEIPSKEGCDFLGWKPSHDIEDKNGKKFKAGEIIAVGTGQAIKNLDANLLVPALKAKNNNRPAEKLIFTAVWKDKEKADYAVQFWAEKADHDDNATTAQKYEYMGTRVYKDVNTGTRPDLATEPVKDIVFPDLDQARLKKIWANVRFNRGRDLYLNKFFVYNQALTADQNKDPKKVNLVKAVNANGKTVYNIYYDRQVYDLYFTKSNALPAENTFYPEIWGYDESQGEIVKKGGPGNPYHYKARFNQLMLGWPNDAMQTKGFSEGMQSFGWGPNYSSPNFPTHLDTPPYRLNADEFLDMEKYDTWGGYTKKIDKGDGTSIDLMWYDYKILSFGIKQDKGSMPHHMDFWMDGFKDDETIIRYDLYRYKADTNSDTYSPKYPKVQGFTGKSTNETPEFLDSDGIDEKNDERADVTPFPAKTYTDMYGERPVGMMKFIKAFLNNGDEWGDPDGWDGFDKNGYLKFEYTRNKYPLRFNYDPSKIKDDSEFDSTNQLDTFYEFPLKALSPDLEGNEEYKKDNPANLLDNPENLQKLGLTDLVFKDTDGKLKVKRPEGLSPQMVFKGWALDPAGSKLVLGSKGETMPSHPVNLYAKWGEPDYKWKVTFDPNGGKMPDLKPKTITSEEKTIREGDIGFEREVTYPLAGYKNQDGTKIEPTVDGKKIFTVIQRQKLVPPEIPTRKGYEFMGWELVRYKKDDKGNLKLDQNNKPIEDTSYWKEFDVPELYSFDNDVVSDLYLRAIWNKNDLIDIKVYHHFLDKDYKEESMQEQVLQNRRVGSYVGAVGSRQDASRILVPKDEWDILAENNKTDKAGSMTYSEYVGFDPVNPRVNSYYQQIVVKPLKITKDDNELIDNPEAKFNVFHYYYRPFRKREYKVNYLDVRAKDKIETIFEIRALKKEIPKLKIQIKRASDKAEKEKLEDIKKKKEKRLEELEKKPTESLVTLSKNYAIIDQETVNNGNLDFDARNYRHIPGWVLADGEKPQQQLFFDVNEETNELLGINGTGSDEIYFFYKDVRVVEVPGDKEPPTGYVRVTFKADNGGSFGKDDKGNDIKELHYDVIKGFRSDNLLVPQVLKTGEEKDSKKYYITPDNGKNFIEWTDSKLLNSDTILEKNYSFTAKFDWSGLSSSGLVTTESFKDSNNTWTNNFAPKIEDLKKQLVWRVKEEEKPLPEGTEIKFFNEAGKELTSDEDVFNLLLEKKAADKEELVRTVNITAKVNFKDKKDTQELNIPIKIYKNVYEALNKDGDKPLFLTEAEKKDAKDGGLKDVTGNYVKVTVAPTGDMDAKDNKVYYVNPKAWVEIPEVKADGSSSFINWTADQAKQNEDEKANGKFDFAKRHKFTDDTVISPRFSQTNELVVYESYKDSKNNWVNDFISSELTETKLKEAVHVKDAKGNIIALGDGDTVTIVDDDGNPYADETALKDALYKKLKEIPDGKVSRTENIKVKVRFANGETQTLDIPVKVIKNIYEAKTEAGKPNYVPANYVKVTFDPTTKAKDPQKYFYYVNPDAKVQIPGKDPVGAKEDFTGWTIKADSAAADEAGTAYKLNERHQFEEASTITAQYGQGKAKIKYVDENKNEIAPKYRIDGVDYPAEKIGMLGDNIPDPGYNQDAEKAAAPKFKGYIISGVSVDKKPANYTDPATATITYQYYKKVITDTPTNPNVYFPVIFNANGGEFESDPKDKKTVYVYFDGNNATVEKVTFEELRQAVEEKYGKPSKANENFIEWQNNKNNGLAVDDAYEIKFKGWNWDADPDNGYVPEIFYANYGKVSANIAYLDLDGKPIADEFKFLTDAEAQGLDEAGKKAALDKKYPTEKAGTADDAIDKNVYTAETAPKFTGYKFNRIELNPKNGKYALKDKATIKIYYEKDLDVIPAKDVTEKPDGYVEVKFVPTDNAKDKTEKIFYVNPKKEVTIPIANPEGAQYFTFKEWKMGANADGAVYKPSAAQKFTDALTVITATYESSENIIPYNPSATDPM
ncbi:MAG: InlB B-repeat-containing protein, partial [Fenollaria massiliensis]